MADVMHAPERAGTQRPVPISPQEEFKTVTVFGLGYIGLPTAAVIASRGISVLGVDVKQEIVDKLATGTIHIYEPDLDGLAQKVINSGTLRVSTTPETSDVFMIAVPTPVGADRSPALDSVFSAAKAMAPHLKEGSLVILESTSPVGTTEAISNFLAGLRPDLRFPTNAGDAANVNLAYCPERVLPGRILTEIVDNARCVGGITPKCARRAQRFYKRFVRGACIVTTARTSEMVKLAENAFRDANIAFANELATICDSLTVNVWDVIDLANRHPRVNILKPGPGVGGHCIAVDPWFIVHSAPEQAQLIRKARETNDGRIGYTVDQAVALIEDHPYAKVACLGLAFKANVDDLRESPALEVAHELAQRYPDRVVIVEPYINELPSEFDGIGVPLMSLDHALAECEVAIVLVDHDEFKSIPTSDRRHLSFLDTRGIWRDMMT